MLCACTVDAVLGDQEFARLLRFHPPAQCACRLSLTAGRSVTALPRGAVLMEIALPLRGLEVPDRRCGRARAAGGDALVKMTPWRQSAQHRWYPEAAERIRQGTLDHAVRVRRPHARRCGSQQGRTCLPAEPRRSLCAIAPRDRRCGSLKRRRCPRVDSLQQDQLRPLGASRHHPCGRRRCAARNCFPPQPSMIE